VKIQLPTFFLFGGGDLPKNIYHKFFYGGGEKMKKSK
jgi:hypothetical protein